jgi:(1->4)-alpha-D-glucan 1-alpha-D-glucosylmutase
MFDRRLPVATYRVQLNRQFRFEDARKLVPYLCRLGISDLYASPILKARWGSTHGYDVVDPASLNPELGSEEDFEALSRELKGYEMGLLLDIVPNHMAASPENPWWRDILENGRYSPYAAFFDIDWAAAEDRIILPILTSPYRQALDTGQFSLILDDTGLSVRYRDCNLPLDIRSYRLVLSHRWDTLEAALSSNHPDLEPVFRLINTLEHLPPSSGPQKTGREYHERQAAKETFRIIVSRVPRVKAWLGEGIALFNGCRGRPESFALMDDLLEQQAYRLEFWRSALGQLNYRRFFDVSDLIGLRVEEEEVFQAVHALILRFVREGKVTGLRIDHVDGLRDPRQYLIRLQPQVTQGATEVGRPRRSYVVVEKILSGGETLPWDWPVSGTTGYDFANMLNALFIDGEGARALNEIYRRFTGSRATFDDVVYENKRQVVAELFPGEVRGLGRMLADLARRAESAAGLSAEKLKQALTEVTACLPVYRTYTRTFKVSPRDRIYLEQAVAEARRHQGTANTTAVDFLKRVLTLDFPDYTTTARKETWLDFVLRWQQLTGAVMAKGFEDTALYGYSRLLSLNEVGGDPGSNGLSIDYFHRRNRVRLEHWPHTMNATSTHDTKRSQDTRARINILSEIPEEWGAHLSRWCHWNEPKKCRVKEVPVPEPDIEMLIYQTLIGAWPLNETEVPEFKKRLKDYLTKAVREAKVHTSWLSPDRDYESALDTFLKSILEDSPQNGFLRDLLPFTRKITYYGMLNSLAQVLLKATCPGVPDFYQGAELWDFSLTDPDNRRPVDFVKRKTLLADLTRKEAQGQKSLAQEVISSWQDGRVKLYVTVKALGARRAGRDVFQEGQYLPLKVAGGKQGHVVSFARRRDSTWFLVVAPRLPAKLVAPGTLPVGRRVWDDDRLLLPDGAPEGWSNLFTGESLKLSTSGEKGLPLCDVLSIFPVALLVAS